MKKSFYDNKTKEEMEYIDIYCELPTNYYHVYDCEYFGIDPNKIWLKQDDHLDMYDTKGEFLYPYGEDYFLNNACGVHGIIPESDYRGKNLLIIVPMGGEWIYCIDRIEGMVEFEFSELDKVKEYASRYYWAYGIIEEVCEGQWDIIDW